MKKYWKKILLCAAVLLLCVGIFPPVYSYLRIRETDRQHEAAIQEYIDAVGKLSDDGIGEIMDRARQYNEEFAVFHPHIMTELTQRQASLYPTQLTVPGTDVIGYIEIPLIDLRLPIYHYADDATMEKGCGHFEVSSLPIGGIGTHSFIAAHRAMPDATMFKNLDKLAEGDTFSVTVLNQTITYEVDNIRVVEEKISEEVFNDLIIENDKDYCTLMTCTPYGKTTHRLLVRGKRAD